MLHRESAVITALKSRLAAGCFRVLQNDCPDALSGRSILFEMPTSYLERYTSLIVPDRSRLTGGSFSRLVILPARRRRCANDCGFEEEEERRHGARGGDRNHILHYDTADESRTRGLPQPPIAARWPVRDVIRYFRFEKDRYPRSRHPPTLCSAGRRRVAFLGLVRLQRAEFFFSSVPSNVAEGMNPKITL